MQLSTRARYAARAVIELAGKHGQGPVQLKDIAECQSISDKYLEQLLSPLRAKGIIRTIRGNKGGYLLARPPEDVTLYEIIETVEGKLAPVPCVNNPDMCERHGQCIMTDIWSDLKDIITKELSSKNLAELVSLQEEKYGREQK